MTNEMKLGTSDERIGGYDPSHFENLLAVEERHFWFRTRNDVISAFAARIVKDLPTGYRVLEIGCGNGNVLRALENVCQRGIVVGMDLYQEGLKHARRRTSCHIVRGDVKHAPLGRAFHLIGIFDVLEHINDDTGVLRDIRSLLHDDGALLITVPAHNYLWSYFDQAAGHCRRYETDELRAKLEKAGYRVEYLTQFMGIIHPFVWLRRRARPKSITSSASPEELVRQELRVIPVVNEVLSIVLRWETRWLTGGRRLPLGTSLLAVARKGSRGCTWCA